MPAGRAWCGCQRDERGALALTLTLTHLHPQPPSHPVLAPPEHRRLLLPCCTPSSSHRTSPKSPPCLVCVFAPQDGATALHLALKENHSAEIVRLLAESEPKATSIPALHIRQPRVTCHQWCMAPLSSHTQHGTAHLRHKCALSHLLYSHRRRVWRMARDRCPCTWPSRSELLTTWWRRCSLRIPRPNATRPQIGASVSSPYSLDSNPAL